MMPCKALLLCIALGGLSACERAPQPELQSRPPATEGVPAPQLAPGAQIPAPETSPANPNQRP